MAETEDQIKWLAKSLADSMVPAHLRDGLLMFISHGVLPGDFLTAVLQNNLLRAFEKADPESEAGLRHIVLWLFNSAPYQCWLNPAAVQAWCKVGGLTGHGTDSAPGRH